MAKKANVEKYINVINAGDKLHGQYKAYESQYVHRAHEELYGLLSMILVYVRKTFQNNNVEEVVRAVRRQLKDKYNIKTTKKTDDVGVLIRLVLRGAHRKTLHTYGRVITQAMNNNVASEDLADYIKENGGIEKLRVGAIEAATKAEYDKQQLLGNLHMSKFAVDLLNANAANALATFEIDKALDSRMHDTANRCEFRYMVCTYNGKYSVVDMVPMDKELESQLLARIANKKAELEYFMSNEELRTFERVKKEYAIKAGLKSKPSKYSARLAAANDKGVDKTNLEMAA